MITIYRFVARHITRVPHAFIICTLLLFPLRSHAWHAEVSHASVCGASGGLPAHGRGGKALPPPGFFITATDVLKNTTRTISDALPNTPPAAVPDTGITDINAPLSGNVLANDTDIENNALTASLVTAPVNGTVVLNSNGSYTYTPNAGYTGPDSLIYQVCDNGIPSLCDTATLLFTIAVINDRPVAAADSVTVTEDIPATGNVLTNDSDPEGDALTASLVTAPVNGTVVLNADGSFTYTPNSNFAGTDSLIYQLCDNGSPSLCDTATLYMIVANVNDGPVAVADSVTVTENIPSPGNVLSNDSDPEGDALTSSLVTAPVNGTVVLNADGSFTYTPNTSFTGIDSLIYQVCDNGTPSLCDTAALYMTVVNVNDRPIAVADPVTLTEDIPSTGNVLTNDSDPEGDALTASLVTAPVNGTVVLNADGSFTYTPNSNFAGTDSLIYQVCDNGSPSLCDTAALYMIVVNVNDRPVAVADSVTVTEDIPATGNVLTNDTDTEGDALTASLVTAPVNGTVVLNADGSFTYTPGNNFSGTDSLIYQVCDNGTPSLCDTATLYMIVTPVNEKPEAVDNAYTLTEDTELSVPAPGLLANDSDPDGDTLTVAVITPPAQGTLTPGPGNSFTYTPSPDFFGSDTTYYTITDGGGLSDTARAVFTVNAINDAPVALPDSVVTNQEMAVSGNVILNDSDIDNDTLMISLVTAPSNGDVILNNRGPFTYTPDPGYTGRDTLRYQLCDNGVPSRCDTATLYITVINVNEKPVAADDVYTVEEDDTLNVPRPGLLVNDSDPDGDGLAVLIITSTKNGTLTLHADSSLTYLPNPDFFGNDTAFYTIADPGGLADTGRVIFTVTSVNDAPVAADEAFTTKEDSVATGNLLTNDSDPEGNTLTASIVTAPVNGALALVPGGAFTYPPASGFSGADSAVYKVCDNGTPSRCDTAIVRFAITPVNKKPVAVDDTASVTAGETVAREVLLNDSDPDNNTLTASIIGEPQHGTLVFTPSGSASYTADADYEGADTIVYRVCDNGTPSLCDTGHLYITIIPAPEHPAAGLAKAANAAELLPDGAYRQTFVFTLRNTGDANLKNVMTGDDLRKVFPAAVTYTIENISASGTLIANTAFNGAADTALLQNLSTLDAGAQDSITLTLIVNAHNTFGPSENSATLQAQSVRDNIPVTDVSNDGRDAAAAGNQVTSFSFAANAVIGLAKAVSGTKLETDGSSTFTFTFYLRNMGNAALSQIRLADDLQAAFPPPVSFRVVGSISATGGLSPNPAFDGVTDQQLLTSANSMLGPGREDTVRVTMNVMPNRSFGTFNNLANVTATVTGSGGQVTDVSMNGNLGDPDGNGIPDEQGATPVVLNPTQLRIPQGFSPNGDGINDRFVIANMGSDKITLEVFNRWGSPVFKSAEYRNDWDGSSNLGTYAGQRLPDGTYYYVAVNITTGEKYVNFITIMR
ncbi:MAG: Ig-like domain-containing protein [Chitinophaga sp.]